MATLTAAQADIVTGGANPEIRIIGDVPVAENVTETTAHLPATQTAIIAGEDGDFFISSDVPLPELLADEILVKTAAVALNPVDTKLVGDFVTPGCVFGFDFAGVVVAVGPAMQRRDLAVGDRVCGSASGMNRDRPLGGAFAQYVALPANFALKVPPAMTLDKAAALGTAVASACMALFWSLGLPLSYLETPVAAPAPSVLVYGGSTSTGTMTIQLLHLCGFHVLTTCSPHNTELVKSYGADVVFDYKTPGCAQEIRSQTGNALDYAVDCVAEDSTMRFCYTAIGRAGGCYTALNPFNDLLATRKVVTPDWILATRITGAGSAWPAPYGCEPEPRLRELAGPLFVTVQNLLDRGSIRPHPVRVDGDGFEAVVRGVSVIRKGGVSGEKLVYRIS